MLRRTTYPTPEERRDAISARNAARCEVALNQPKCSATTSGGLTGVAVGKGGALQHRGYMAAVRNLGYCVRCGRTCRPQFCHRDEGKATGLKTDCREGWAGCGYWSPEDPGCHFIVGTSGTLPKQERRAEDLRLGQITRNAIRAAGTWPKGLEDDGK